MRIPTIFTPELQRRFHGPGRALALAGGLLFAVAMAVIWLTDPGIGPTRPVGTTRQVLNGLRLSLCVSAAQ